MWEELVTHNMSWWVEDTNTVLNKAFEWINELEQTN